MTKKREGKNRIIFSKKGETLIETLVSILITVLSITALASMIISANMTVRSSSETLSGYYLSNNDLESGTGVSAGSGTVTLMSGASPVKISQDDTGSFTVNYYVNSVAKNTGVISYR